MSTYVLDKKKKAALLRSYRLQQPKTRFENVPIAGISLALKGTSIKQDKRLDSILNAVRSGTPLPPVILVELPGGGYAIDDGRRRIAISGATGKSHVPAIIRPAER